MEATEEYHGHSIKSEEAVGKLEKFHNATAGERMRMIFEVFDEKGNGTIGKAEFKHAIHSCAQNNFLELTEETLNRLTDIVFEMIAVNGQMAISDVKEQFEKYPDILETLSQRAMDLREPASSKKLFASPFQRYFTSQYIQNNLKRIVFMIIYLTINVILFTITVVRYRDSNCCIIIARGCGMCLNFNCAFAIVLILRKTITLLRTTRAALFLPLDDNIYLHKVVGVVIGVQTLVHTVAHLINVQLALCHQISNTTVAMVHNHHHFEYWQYLFTTDPDIGWISGLAPLSGILLDICLLVMFICSLDFVRRNGYFQIFYWTHMLYIPFWILLFIHAPSFWCFFMVPLILFIVEKVSRSRLVKIAKHGRTYITEAIIHSSRVTHLVIPRPDNFKYRAGDYAFIQIPRIAMYEWHPFTISSAPEMTDSLWFHVRSVGNWTNKVHQLFSQHPTSLACHNKRSAFLQEQHIALQIDCPKPQGESAQKLDRKKVKIPVSIDGPYGTPSRDIFETEHAVLVAAGIGVTPFASILQSIMYKHRASKKVCPNCCHEWFGDMPKTVMDLKKVDFIWINRDQKSFEWFLNLLTQLEIDQEQEDSFDRFLELHMYMTATFGSADMDAFALQMALDLFHKKENRDFLTGLRSQTHPGRPNWDQILPKILAQNKGKVEVFFCGNATLGKELRQKCEQYRIRFNKERF